MSVTTGPGVLLGDRYRLAERIAVGGQGEVWKAEDTALGRTVAVKVLRGEYTGDGEFRARFRREARHAAALSHPGVAQVFDYDEGVPPYLVMQYVDGESLAETIARSAPLPAARVLEVIAAVASALAAAHNAGVVHRDVKPANLLVGRDGSIKITDFGIARAMDAAPLTQVGTVMGTPSYLPPEAAWGLPMTAAADLYALGVIAYEMLTGRPPYEGPASAVVIAHRDAPLPSLPPGVPAGLQALILNLCAKTPASRPPNATAVATRAEQLRTELPPSPTGEPHPAEIPSPRPAGTAGRPPGATNDAGEPHAEPIRPVHPQGVAGRTREPHEETISAMHPPGGAGREKDLHPKAIPPTATSRDEAMPGTAIPPVAASRIGGPHAEARPPGAAGRTPGAPSGARELRADLRADAISSPPPPGVGSRAGIPREETTSVAHSQGVAGRDEGPGTVSRPPRGAARDEEFPTEAIPVGTWPPVRASEGGRAAGHGDTQVLARPAASESSVRRRTLVLAAGGVAIAIVAGLFGWLLAPSGGGGAVAPTPAASSPAASSSPPAAPPAAAPTHRVSRRPTVVRQEKPRPGGGKGKGKGGGHGHGGGGGKGKG